MLLCTTHTGTVTRSFFCRLAYLFLLRANKGEINGFYFSFLTEFFSSILNYSTYLPIYNKKNKIQKNNPLQSDDYYSDVARVSDILIFNVFSVITVCSY